jgi:hypothetical protein
LDARRSPQHGPDAGRRQAPFVDYRKENSDSKENEDEAAIVHLVE